MKITMAKDSRLYFLKVSCYLQVWKLEAVSPYPDMACKDKKMEFITEDCAPNLTILSHCVISHVENNPIYASYRNRTSAAIQDATEGLS